MGIPSYFKRLTDTVKGLLVSEIKGGTLLLDFNCIVYGCLRSETLAPFNGEDSWEGLLNEEVCKYVVKIWDAAGKPKMVHIAVDGVVPMAKIKQQRMRRFKSIWWTEKEYEMGVKKRDVPRWDTNAITPGTLYMEKLGLRLKQLCASRGWTVSTSDEPGEGEHKVMELLRSKPVEGPVIIYGLDADLILLSMLTAAKHLGDTPVYLMREKAEFGKTSATPFLFLSVNHLMSTLFSGPASSRYDFVLDYIAVMSILGNDFLPHGLTLKIRDGGHDALLELLRGFHKAGKHFVADGKICRETFRELFCLLAESEEAELEAAIFRKKKTRPMNPRNDTERLMQPVQGLPVEWFVERQFLDRGRLSADWLDIYREHAPVSAISYYMYGLQWIIDYYRGEHVNKMWFYPWHLPPTWTDLCSVAPEMVEPRHEEQEQEPIKPQEQLAIVLPMESWHLVRDKKLRNAPVALPQFWPQKFGFVSLGKTWMWECEADIPILLVDRVRSLA